MSEKHKKCAKVLNYFKLILNFKLLWTFLVLVSAASRCVQISTFASLAGVPIGVASSAEGLKICAITAGIKKGLKSISQ